MTMKSLRIVIMVLTLAYTLSACGVRITTPDSDYGKVVNQSEQDN